jgi:hypothetical protein
LKIIKVKCNNRYELIAKIFLLPTINLTEKYYSVLLAVMSIWKPNLVLDDTMKNLLCDKLGYEGQNKWQSLVSDINKLTNIHKKIGEVASPLILPNFEKRTRSRTLRLHPELEKVLSGNFTKLTVEYSY